MSLRHLFLLSALSAIAGCAQIDNGEPETDATTADESESANDSAGEAYRAAGQEPGWLLEIGADSMTLSYAYGEKTATTPLPEAEMTEAYTRYHAVTEENDLDVIIYDEVCADVMSGRPYPDRVTVVINGETLNGCGGDTKSLLTGEEWIVEDINGGGVIDYARTSIAFGDDNKVTGSGGCNRFSGSYQITGEGIQFGPIAATRKACAMALMDQEISFFSVLETAYSFEIEGDGALKVTGGENQSFTARR